MDKIITPFSIHQPAIITPRAPHYNEEERKKHTDEKHHDEEESDSEQVAPDELHQIKEGSVGSKLDIQI